MEKYTVYAFANGPGEGNGAGVVLMDSPEELSDRQKQEIAAEFGFSETAFLYEEKEAKDSTENPGPKTASFSIRYFTPVCEVPLCGHATIASFSLLYQKQMITDGTCWLRTKEQDLPVTVEDGFVWMDMGMPAVEEKLDDVQTEALCRAYGLDVSDLNKGCPPRIVNAGIRDIHMIVKDHETLMRAVQDTEKSLAVTECFGEVGVHMSCLPEDPADRYTAYCSNFGPAFGIEEECATGTASAGLSAYLDALGKYPAEGAVLLQGEHMGKPSEIRSRKVYTDGELRICIGGRGFVI